MKSKYANPFSGMPNSVKIFVVTAMASTVALGWNIQVKADMTPKSEQTLIHTVYHIYYGSKPIGTVDNKEIINQLINEAISKAEKANPHLDYVLAKDLSIIPEKTFNKVENNDQTAKALQNVLNVKPHAIAIVIDGKPVVYVKSKADAEQVLHQFKTQYVPDSVLNALAQVNDKQVVSIDQMAKVKKDDSAITNVHLLNRVSFKDDKVDQPSEIMSIDEAVHTISNGNLKNSKYIVQEGDVLGSIAQKFNMSLNELLALNPSFDENTMISIGNSITVKKPKPYLELAVEKEAIKYEDMNYKKVIKENDSMYKGESRVIKKGHIGKKRVLYHLTLKNGMVVKKVPIVEEVLEKPIEEIIEKGTKAAQFRGTGDFCWPAAGGVSSTFGYRWGELHKGIDISKNGGLNIVAADNGVVVYAGWDSGGYGNRIIINHNNGYRTTYNHLSHISVHTGQVVHRGQSIGQMGETGDASGVHLHFEVYKNGSLVNPLSVLQ